jgi:hypothetical protein
MKLFQDQEEVLYLQVYILHQLTQFQDLEDGNITTGSEL